MKADYSAFFSQLGSRDDYNKCVVTLALEVDLDFGSLQS